jgi:hypothetical protein
MILKRFADILQQNITQNRPWETCWLDVRDVLEQWHPPPDFDFAADELKKHLALLRGEAEPVPTLSVPSEQPLAQGGAGPEDDQRGLGRGKGDEAPRDTATAMHKAAKQCLRALSAESETVRLGAAKSILQLGSELVLAVECEERIAEVEKRMKLKGLM